MSEMSVEYPNTHKIEYTKDEDENIISIARYENDKLVEEEDLLTHIFRKYQQDANGEPQLVHEFQKNGALEDLYDDTKKSLFSFMPPHSIGRGYADIKEKQWTIDSDGKRQLVLDVERDKHNLRIKEQRWELDSKNQRRLVYVGENLNDRYSKKEQQWYLTSDDKLILQKEIDGTYEKLYDEQGILEYETGYDYYQYERLDGCEFLRDYSKHHITFKSKEKDIVIDISEPDVLTEKFKISQNGVSIDITKSDGRSIYDIDFIHTSPQGVETKLFIKEYNLLNSILRSPRSRSGSGRRLHSNEIKELDNIFRKEYEKYPDGTYREWDRKERLVKEDLPDGTSIRWKYYDNDVQKFITKGNETSEYLNDEYYGKKVINGSVTSWYNSDNIKYKEKDTENGTESTFYENGNIKTQEENGTRIRYYDSEGNKVAFEHMGQLFMLNKKATDMMHKRYQDAMTKGYKEEAKSCLLKMCMLLNYFDPQKYNTACSMLVKNELQKYQIKDLGDGKVAFGAIFEDRHWVKETFRGNGIEWYWKCAAAIIDVKNCGLVASCETTNERVRHPTNPEYDIWNKLDSEFITIDEENGKLTVGLKADEKYGGQYYTKASIDFKKKIAEYDEQMLELCVSNKLQELKDKAKSENIEDIPHAKTQVLREIAKNNISSDQGVVNRKHSDSDKRIIKAAIDKAINNTRN